MSNVRAVVGAPTTANFALGNATPCAPVIQDSSTGTLYILASGDKIVDGSIAFGLYLKDAQVTAHYWGLTVTASGVLVTTDLGTTRP